MAKRKNFARECWDLMETITSMVRPAYDKKGNYKIKKGFKKKDIRSIRRKCPHWLIGKHDKPTQAVRLIRNEDGTPTGMVECRFCHERFPLIPYEDQAKYDYICNQFMQIVNQLEYWDVDMGGSKDNLKMFIALREYTPRLRKVAESVRKAFARKDKISRSKEAAQMGNGFRFHGGGWTETNV